MGEESKSKRVVDERVAANLRRLRRGRFTTQQLSDRLEELGWHIRPVGLTNIETGKRHVSADDLLAIAIALGVSPNRLLLPEESLVATEGVEYGVEVVGSTYASARDVWRWASGEKPLVQHDLEDWESADEPSGLDVAMFQVQNRPHDWVDAYSKSRAALRAVLDSGVPPEALREHLDRLVEDAVREAVGADGAN